MYETNKSQAGRDRVIHRQPKGGAVLFICRNQIGDQKRAVKTWKTGSVSGLRLLDIVCTL